MEPLPLVDRWVEGSHLATPYALRVEFERFLDVGPGCWYTLYSRMHPGSLSVCSFPSLYRVSSRLESNILVEHRTYVITVSIVGSNILPSQFVLLIREHICISIGFGNERTYCRRNHLRLCRARDV